MVQDDEDQVPVVRSKANSAQWLIVALLGGIFGVAGIATTIILFSLAGLASDLSELRTFSNETRDLAAEVREANSLTTQLVALLTDRVLTIEQTVEQFREWRIVVNGILFPPRDPIQ